MVRNIIRYVLLVLVVVGIVLLFSSLTNGDGTKFNSNDKSSNNSVKYYTASIKVLDDDSRKFIVGGEFVLKTSNGDVVEEWKSTENIKRVSKLKNGTYVLEQKSASNGYDKADKITFKIYNSNKDIVVYNNKVKEEDVISNNEIVVDNTLSVRSVFTYIVASVCLLCGLILIRYKKINI